MKIFGTQNGHVLMAADPPDEDPCNHGYGITRRAHSEFRQDRKMIKQLSLLTFLVIPSVAFGQVGVPERPNHTLPQYRIAIAANNNASAPHSMLRTAKTPARDYAARWSSVDIRKDTRIPSLYADGSTGTLEQIGRMADSSVQQVDIGTTVAPLDANNMMSAAVSGDTSAAPVTATGAVKARQLADRAADQRNIKDYGASLTGSSADEAPITTAFSENAAGQKIFVPGGVWPAQSWWPAETGKTKFVEASGYLSNPPNTSVTDYSVNIGAYNFGNGVTSLTHGGQYFPSSAMYSRVSTGSMDTSYDPMVSYRQIFDGKSSNTQGNVTVETVGITTKSSSGYVTNRFDKLFSMGNNYSGSFDVNHWHRTQTYGTNDAWDNIQEFGESVSFFCPPFPDDKFCPDHYINEEDFGGYGNDKAETAYDPTASTRKMFWLTTNTIAAQKPANSRWKASAVIHKYQLVVVMDAANKPWMFYGLPAGYVPGSSNNTSTATTGATQPAWVFTTGATVQDGGVTWNCAGPFTYDIGSVFRIGGSNNPSSGWIERIGTVLSEETDYIYNAAIDMSKASFEPSVPYKVFGRLQKDMYLDMSADGTQAGQNNHLLGYDGSSNALTYKVNGVPVLSVKDSGAIVSSAPSQLPIMTRAQIRAYPSPAKGMQIYDRDDDAPVIYTGTGWKLMTLSALPAN